jgi:hypothetical protein
METVSGIISSPDGIAWEKEPRSRTENKGDKTKGTSGVGTRDLLPGVDGCQKFTFLSRRNCNVHGIVKSCLVYIEPQQA